MNIDDPIPTVTTESEIPDDFIKINWGPPIERLRKFGSFYEAMRIHYPNDFYADGKPKLITDSPPCGGLTRPLPK